MGRQHKWREETPSEQQFPPAHRAQRMVCGPSRFQAGPRPPGVQNYLYQKNGAEQHGTGVLVATVVPENGPGGVVVRALLLNR